MRELLGRDQSHAIWFIPTQWRSLSHKPMHPSVLPSPLDTHSYLSLQHCSVSILFSPQGRVNNDRPEGIVGKTPTLSRRWRRASAAQPQGAQCQHWSRSCWRATGADGHPDSSHFSVSSWQGQHLPPHQMGTIFTCHHHFLKLPTGFS